MFEAHEDKFDFPAMGWLPDVPDLRDYGPETDRVKEISQPLLTRVHQLPAKVDLRPWFSTVENQGRLGSCTAHAAAGVVEYFERRTFHRHIDVSRRFIYKVTRKLLGWTGDTGAFLRTTMAALVLFGAPPERYWPYTDGPGFDEEPPVFVYSLARNYQALTYFRHDPRGAHPSDVLQSLKKYLAAGVPAMFGFAVYSILRHPHVVRNGEIPLPAPRDRMEGGHAVVLAGYDDEKEINHPTAGTRTKGAFLIRNSWGPRWGDRGYGWLPYAYVERRLAQDFWSLLSMEWVDLAKFNL